MRESILPLMPALPAILHRGQPMDCLERGGKLTLIRIAQGSRDIGHGAAGGQKQGGGPLHALPS